jgi:hypothetical protein
MRVLQGNPPWACLVIRHELLRPMPPWSFQQLGRPVGNPPYHPDGPPWLAGLGLRRWYTYLVCPQHDTSLFILRWPALTLYLLVYVDDIIVVSSSSAATDRLVHQLGTSFALKDLGPFHYFLGVEVHTPTCGGLLLSQRKYASELLLKAGLQKCAQVTTPMVAF